MKEIVNIKKYIIKFIIAYIVLLLIMSVIEVFFLEDPIDNTSLFTSVILASAMYTMTKFVTNNVRVPHKSEKVKLVWSSLLVIWIHLLISFVTNYNTLKIDYIWSSLSLLVTSIIFYITLNLIYGYCAKFQYNIMKKKGVI